mmetsp:Transcript_42275/g.140084  ORF Transcript_42275/g.140084 Transcript_42275/m.140084 type:complete len:217 (+) Transcript_42275:47-697(+)
MSGNDSGFADGTSVGPAAASSPAADPPSTPPPRTRSPEAWGGGGGLGSGGPSAAAPSEGGPRSRPPPPIPTRTRPVSSFVETWSGRLRSCNTDTLTSALLALNASTDGSHSECVRRLVLLFKLNGKPSVLLQRWPTMTLRAVAGSGSLEDRAGLVKMLLTRFFPDALPADGKGSGSSRSTSSRSGSPDIPQSDSDDTAAQPELTVDTGPGLSPAFA